MTTAGTPTWLPWAHPSPLLDRLGDLRHDASDPLRFGFEVDEPKLNGRGFLHAGAISTIADVCIGHALSATSQARYVTVDLHVALLGTAHPGDWVDVAVRPLRLGRRIASGTAELTSRGALVAHVTAMFVPTA